MPGYRLAKCNRCETVWDPLPPEQLIPLYTESYFINENPKGGYANYYEGMRINRKTFSNRLEKIEKKLGKTGKLLDVGCALGDFLIEAKARGWDKAEGIEISHYAAKIATKRGIKATEGTLTGNSYAEKSFDIITFQDVIEHLPNPLKELRTTYKILKSGGFVFLVTPDVGSFWAKMLGPLWYHYKPYEHLIYFSEKNMKRALEEVGFENIDIRKTYHILSLEYILNRLRYYFPSIFELLLKVIKRAPFKNIPFKLYIGEIEAWGQKKSKN